MRTLRITLAYDGTDFLGWQLQAEGRTVQGELEKAVERITGQRVRIAGAGRTDAGVHALGQVASLRIQTSIPASKLCSALNSLTPDDIAVLDVADAPPHFHARYSACGKVYWYRIHNHPVGLPFYRRWAWHIRTPLDRAAMRDAAARLLGSHDFSSFRLAGCDARTPVCELRRLDLVELGEGILQVEVEAPAFLRGMVRAIVGTLVEVGRHRLSPGAMAAILEARNRAAAGRSAPACGLYLAKVHYLPDYGRPCYKPTPESMDNEAKASGGRLATGTGGDDSTTPPEDAPAPPSDEARTTSPVTEAQSTAEADIPIETDPAVEAQAAALPEAVAEVEVPVEECEPYVPDQTALPVADETAKRLAALEAEKEEMEERLTALRNQLLRTAADFDNFRKRVARQEQEVKQRARAEALRAFLPVMDDVDRALGFAQAMPGGEQLADGLRMVVRSFLQAFASEGLARIETVGQPFDPAMHEAVGQIETSDTPAGHVVQELRAGYLLGDRLLRPAAVTVAKPPAPPEAAEIPAPETVDRAAPADEAPPEAPADEVPVDEAPAGEAPADETPEVGT